MLYKYKYIIYKKILSNSIMTNIENANSIIKSNQLEACDECCYCPALRTGEPISNTPFLLILAFA